MVENYALFSILLFPAFPILFSHFPKFLCPNDYLFVGGRGELSTDNFTNYLTEIFQLLFESMVYLDVWVIWIGCSKLSCTSLFFSVFVEFRLTKNGFGFAFVLEGERGLVGQPLLVLGSDRQHDWNRLIRDLGRIN